MAKCDYCSSRILFGGVKEQGFRFCNDTCYQNGVVLAVADQVPQDAVHEFLMETHQGMCPKCEGQGPVDVHTSHRVWSALVMTQWNSRLNVCCQGCGTKAKVGDACFCLVLGWWGIPWGILMTPVQIVRNLWGIFSRKDPNLPSPELENLLRIELATRLMAGQAEDPNR